MNVQTIVQASARVVTITELAPGNVYKRLVDSSYSDDKLTYGVVHEVLNNGSDAVILGLEFSTSYSDVNTKLEVFSGDKDLKIFAAEPYELDKYLEDAVSNLEREVEKKREALTQGQAKLDEVKDILKHKVDRKTLSAPTLNIES